MSCQGCGEPGDGAMCWKCGYARAIERAHDRFRPLSEALARRLEISPQVWQTGGMVMCLAVPCGPAQGEEVDDYVLFADLYDDEPDWEAEPASFGRYVAGEYVDSIENHDIPFRRVNAELIAEWAAPLILDWASKCASTVDRARP